MIDQLGNRQSRATRSLLLLFVKLVETDWKSSLSHADAISNFAKIEWIFFVALLITRVVKAHQNPLVRQIRLQHSSAGKGHPHRQRLLIHFKNRNVLEFIAVFLSDINFTARKFVDHLIAAEKRHRISSCEIVETGTQFFLRRGSDLHIEPQANGGADKSDKGERDANARHTHAIGAKRDELVIGRQASENQQDRG